MDMVQGCREVVASPPLESLSALAGDELAGVELGNPEVAAGVKSDIMVLGTTVDDAEGAPGPCSTASPLPVEELAADCPNIPPIAPLAVMRFSALFWLVQAIVVPGLDTDGRAKQNCDLEHWPWFVSQVVPRHFAMDLPMHAVWPSLQGSVVFNPLNSLLSA